MEAAVQERKLHGILAEFSNPGELVKAANTVRSAGYQQFDTYSPFPIHGMDEAMGLKKSKVGLIVLISGIIGGCGALLMMIWMLGIDYTIDISGKPHINLPAFVPITFELTVLLSSFGALFGMLGLNKLPKHYNPLFNSERFSKHATDDGFFLCIESKDSLFAEDKVKHLFEETGARHVEEIFE